jgi:hypothetical protein
VLKISSINDLTSEYRNVRIFQGREEGGCGETVIAMSKAVLGSGSTEL